MYHQVSQCGFVIIVAIFIFTPCKRSNCSLLISAQKKKTSKISHGSALLWSEKMQFFRKRDQRRGTERVFLFIIISKQRSKELVMNSWVSIYAVVQTRWQKSRWHVAFFSITCVWDSGYTVLWGADKCLFENNQQEGRWISWLGFSFSCKFF